MNAPQIETATPLLLDIRNVHAGYGESLVLEGLSINVGAGQVVCLLGANGVGKTTTLMVITGIVLMDAPAFRRRADALRRRVTG